MAWEMGDMTPKKGWQHNGSLAEMTSLEIRDASLVLLQYPSDLFF
jgi:hypothetical protein